MRTRFLTSVIALFGLCGSAHAQQVVWGESFESTTFLPSGWSAVSASINRWSRQSSSTNPNITLGAFGIGFAKFQANGTAPNTVQTIALSPVDYRVRGSKTPYVSFYMYRDSLNKNADSLGIYINTTASLTGATHLLTVARYSRLNLPDTQVVNGWYKYKCQIPATFSGAKNYIMFKAIGRAGNNIYIDSIQWDEYPLKCTGTPSGSVIASNPEVICGGTGTATLTLSGGQADYNGISITWQVGGTSTGPWTNFGGSSLSVSTGTINITKFYRCILNCVNSGLSDTTNVYVMKVVSAARPTITVSPNPANYCAGATPLLLIASGAVSYSWTPATSLNITTNDSVYTSPATNITYQVSGTDANGCTGTTNITVNLRQSPNVAITALDSNLCAGDSVRLAAAGGGFQAYTWSPGGQTTAAVWVKPDTSTRYGLTVRNNFNCYATSYKNIYVKQQPQALFGYQANGNVYHFLDSSTGASAWHWLFGDGNESFKENPLYTFSGDTMYTVTLVVSDPPCRNDTVSMLIRGNPAFLKQLNRNDVVLGPNPVTDQFSVNLVHGNGSALLELYDVSGRQVFQSQIKSRQKITLDVSSLPRGLYSLKITSGDQHFSEMLYKR